jgi:hypothetical protein
VIFSPKALVKRTFHPDSKFALPEDQMADSDLLLSSHFWKVAF